MKNHHLSHRERVQLALQHQETDRIPIAMVCSGINEPACQEFDDYLRRKQGIGLDKYLDGILDIKLVDPDYVGPSLPSMQDIWGVRRKTVSYGSGGYDEIDYYPLADIRAIDELRNHTWPITDFFDYAVLQEKAKAIQNDDERCLMIANANIFETSWYMRGFERMFMDLATNPELAHGIMKRVTDFYIAHYMKMLSAADGMIDLAFTADDIGGQNGLLMSLDMWEEFVKPYHEMINKVIHEFGVQVIYHSDGAVMEATEGLVDAGVDVLQALQFDAKGMDPVALKAKHEQELCFQGGVSVQKTLPFGSTENVREEVEQLISILGKNGGYILGPSHVIQAGTPPENIFTMFETALNFYPF